MGKPPFSLAYRIEAFIPIEVEMPSLKVLLFQVYNNEEKLKS